MQKIFLQGHILSTGGTVLTSSATSQKICTSKFFLVGTDDLKDLEDCNSSSTKRKMYIGEECTTGPTNDQPMNPIQSISSGIEEEHPLKP